MNGCAPPPNLCYTLGLSRLEHNGYIDRGWRLLLRLHTSGMNGYDYLCLRLSHYEYDHQNYWLKQSESDSVSLQQSSGPAPNVYIYVWLDYGTGIAATSDTCIKCVGMITVVLYTYCMSMAARRSCCHDEVRVRFHISSLCHYVITIRAATFCFNISACVVSVTARGCRRP